MAFLTEPEPSRGTLLPVLPGIHRIVAGNPSQMTYHGTNTYLIEDADGVTVLDPGPDRAAHVADILRLTPAPIRRILLSHTHNDHLGATNALKAATGAVTYGFERSADPGFTPDIPLPDGGQAAGMTAIWTPGHAADHLCFARPGFGEPGVLFSADHVMGWSSSIVSPPGGNMAAYCTSLRQMIGRPEHTYLPGHGPPIADPTSYVQSLLAHRMARENAIANALQDGPMTSKALVEALYSKIDPVLKMAAERNVLAHLEKLVEEGRAVRREQEWVAAAGQQR